MTTFLHIQTKLEQFIKKYYTNELIKGIIMFFAIGLLYFLIILLIEYYFWLPKLGRTILFWLFVGVEAALFFRFIAFPLAKLFKLQKGIDHKRASHIIGNHFPEVGDRLLNVLQLQESKQQSELLLASIEQKSSELKPIPFANAITFKANIKYLKYAAIPVLLYLIFSISGTDIFSSSYKRVVNYNVAYEPPAPFSFHVLNTDLRAIENEPYHLEVQTTGTVIPENARISYNGETYMLHQDSPGVFRYTFEQPITDIDFQLLANDVASRSYTLNVTPVPALLSFVMELDYPKHTQKQAETLKSTGNVVVPEGTSITWKTKTKQTDRVQLKTKDSTYRFDGKNPDFIFSKQFFNTTDYTLSTSNTALEDYENLSFAIQVVKDQYPEIAVSAKKDTVKRRTTHYQGTVSDDYGLQKLQLVYYPTENEEEKKSISLPISRSTVDQFFYTFPGKLELEEGTSYSYYFQVFDNDAVRGSKSSKSSLYSYRMLTSEELEKEQLDDQKQAIDGLSNTLQEMDKQKEQAEEISRMRKEEKQPNWNDRQKLDDYLKRQKLQEEMMKKFSEKMKENLENFQKDAKEKDPYKEELQDRLDKNEERNKENEELLKELEKLKDKIAEEELYDKLEERKKQNNKQQRNLEQLLELTKRYYVEKKAEKLAKDLEKLANEQEKLSEKGEQENTKEKQDALNEKFDSLRKDLEDLRKENQDLQQPIEMPDNPSLEDEIQEDQKDASDKLEQQQQDGAKEKQKDASQKMKQMGQQMQMQMSASQSAEEDVEMLRQIIDNLILYSKEQEALMEHFKSTDHQNPLYGQRLLRQNDLKQNFTHVDDSLFSLALRNPMIGQDINDLIEEVHYNMDKSTELLAENQLRNGLAYQQYAVTYANDLAVLLDNSLNSMQMQMQMSGSGQDGESGEGFQLPDIIEQQESLNKQMEQGMQQGSQGQQQEGQGESEGEGEGEKGSESGEGNDEQGNDGSEGDEGDKQQENGSQNEEMNGALYEIYKKQQELRNQLEDRLRQEGLPADAKELLKEMENVEDNLLNNGFNQETLNRMNEIKHQLLKLNEATFKQGEEEKREATTNRKTFENQNQDSIENAKNYFNNVEILNRQSLPLRQIYQKKVQEYFKQDND